MNGGALNYRGLTLKQACLASYFFDPKSETFGVIAKSARKAGYKGNPRTLAVVGFQTLRSPNMTREVKRRMKSVLSSEETLQEITGIAQQEVTDYKPSDKLKALELLAKFHKLLTDKVESSDTSQVDGAKQAILTQIKFIAQDSSRPEMEVEAELQSKFVDKSRPGYVSTLDPSVHPEIWPSGRLKIEEIGDQ